MDQNTFEWMKVAGSLVGGGAVGAIITSVVSKYRNRIQPVGKHTKIEAVFAPGKLLKDHITKVTFSGATQNFHYDNLYLVQIEIQNEGNKDYTDFNFGITLPKFADVVNTQTVGQDRHHTISLKQTVDFSNPSKIVDFSLKPFNRKDKYSISLYVTCLENNLPMEIEFSSDMPVKFKEIETITGTTLELLIAVLTRGVVRPTFSRA